MNGFDITWVWAFGILGLAAGFGVGIFVGFRFLANNQRADELEQELDAARSAQEEYQQQVTAHFARTAELFQDMTENYRSVYRHLAEGATKLCDETSQGARLDLLDTLGLGESRQPPGATAQPDVSENPATPPEEVTREEPPQEESAKPEFQAEEPADAPAPVEAPTAANAASEFEPGSEEEEKDQAVLH